MNLQRIDHEIKLHSMELRILQSGNTRTVHDVVKEYLEFVISFVKYVQESVDKSSINIKDLRFQSNLLHHYASNMKTTITGDTKVLSTNVVLEDTARSVHDNVNAYLTPIKKELSFIQSGVNAGTDMKTLRNSSLALESYSLGLKNYTANLSEDSVESKSDQIANDPKKDSVESKSDQKASVSAWVYEMNVINTWDTIYRPDFSVHLGEYMKLILHESGEFEVKYFGHLVTTGRLRKWEDGWNSNTSEDRSSITEKLKNSTRRQFEIQIVHKFVFITGRDSNNNDDIDKWTGDIV